MSTEILPLLVFSPLLGMLLLLFVNKQQERLIKAIGVVATLPALVLSLFLFMKERSGVDLDIYNVVWKWFGFGNFDKLNPNLFAVNFELGIDGFSLVMLLLTSILATLSAVAANYIKKEWKGYFFLFFLLEIGMLGVFTAENLILFFLFFEITLIPMFFLIGKWGYVDRERAAFSFLLYNGLGSAVLLIVIMVLFAKTGTSNIEVLQQIVSQGGVTLVANISPELKYGLLIALIIAFGVKLPIFPLHTWMLRVHVQAPPAIVMLHAGVLLKIGAFGLIRFGMGIFPGEFKELSIYIVLLGIINLLYGAFLALIQKDFKMVLAYSSISHMGIVLMGLGARNEAGVQGAIFQVVSHGLIAALLFFLVGLLYERVKTSQIYDIGGLAKSMPITAGFLLAGGMASLGLPGMSGFISEAMAFLGLFKEEPILAAIASVGLIITAVYVLRAVLAITYGDTRGAAIKKLVDIHSYEWAPVLVLVGLIVLIGVFPSILAEPLDETMKTLLGIGG
ncbi:NADH-quinone oxidoreductase subunit M [Bacillus massiliigorillae]|uniref:NADH-quinone oxidoreductase subunit M n=1 Tax=Bacillus massiliigorillae TaxID=1243664 RepID=UPI0003A1C6FE|nr:NADH-quinone oxidoreductase subunit M [Bacillus massiliigorillae]